LRDFVFDVSRMGGTVNQWDILAIVYGILEAFDGFADVATQIP